MSDELLYDYETLCKKNNKPVLDIIVENAIMIDYFLDRYEFTYGQRIYDKDNNAYLIPFLSSLSVCGVVTISDDFIAAQVLKMYPNGEKVEETMVINEEGYTGLFADMIKFTVGYKNSKQKEEKFVPYSTVFNSDGIYEQENDELIPYESVGLSDNFQEALKYQKETGELLIETIKGMHKVEVRVLEHPYVDPNTDPEDIFMKNGKIFIRRRGKRK